MRRKAILTGEKQVVYHSVRQKKAASRVRRKYTFYGFVLVIVILVGYLIGTSVLALNRISSENGFSSLKNLFAGGNLKQTDGITNFLILGRGGSGHEGGLLTDSMILVRLKNSDNKVATVSIPRDLRVKLSNGEYRKINATYGVGYSAQKDKTKQAETGAQYSAKTVESVVGVPIHYWVDLDFAGFKKVVDEIGGVTVNVDKAIHDPYYPKEYFDSSGNYHKTDQYQLFSMPAGVQKMNGETALKFARSRETSSDFDRAKRQQQVIFAVKDKMLSLGILANPKKLADIINIVGDHLRTNLGVGEMGTLVGKVKDINKDAVISKVLDNSSGGLLVSAGDGSSDFVPRSGNFNEIRNFVKNIFNSTDTNKDVSIEVYNASNVPGQARIFADKLKAKGISIAVLDKYDIVLDKTLIEDGTSGQAKSTLELMKEMLGQYKMSTTDSFNVIKVIIGKDYAS